MSNPSEIVRIRLFRPDADVPLLVALLNTIAAGDMTGAVFDEAAVRSQLTWLGHDPARDRWVADAPGDGNLIIGHAWVFAQSPQRAILYAAVHPAWRRKGVGSALLAQAIGRAREMGVSQIVSATRAGRAEADAFLRRHGFLPAGHARTLIAAASLPIPEPAWPPGYMLRTLAEAGDLNLWAEACNHCYADMWGHRENNEPATAEYLAELLRAYPDAFDPAGIFLLLAPDGSPSGVCAGRAEGGEGGGASTRVIDSPGIAPAHRQLGLQRPLVLACLRWLSGLRAGDYRLETWGDSEAAVAIYRELGFVVEDDTVEYLQQPMTDA